MSTQGDEESSPCAIYYAYFVKWFAFMVALFQCGVGVIQIFAAFDPGANIHNFCADLPDSDTPPSGDLALQSKYGLTCIGPQIRWVTEHYRFSEQVNGFAIITLGPRTSWRGVFSFKPSVFLDLWAPMIMGVISLFLHLGHTRADKIADNWIRFGLWFLFQALWGSFGYAGNWGIITGFMGAVLSLCAIFASCIAPHEERVLELHGLLGMVHVGNSEGADK